MYLYIRQTYFRCVHLSPGTNYNGENKEMKLVITLNHTDSDGFITIVQGNQTRSPIFIFYTFIFAKKKFKFVHLSPIVTTTVLVQQKCRNPILYIRQIMCTFVVSLTVKDLQILISAKYRIKNNEYIFIIKAGLIYNWRKFN